MKILKKILPYIVSIMFHSAFGQEAISVKKILQEIKTGKDITYENQIIVGKLDFTFLDDRDLPDSWWDRYWNGKFEKRGVIKEMINSSISFINCTFEDDVLAYIRLDKMNYTLIANFNHSIRFENCTFKKAALFKHSEFNSAVTFAGSQFLGNTNFKYSEFAMPADMSKTIFHQDATFKYAKFDKGISWKASTFKGDLDIKYLNVKGKMISTEMIVDGDVDATYAEIEGQTFISYILSRN